MQFVPLARLGPSSERNVSSYRPFVRVREKRFERRLFVRTVVREKCFKRRPFVMQTVVREKCFDRRPFVRLWSERNVSCVDVRNVRLYYPYFEGCRILYFLYSKG